jgi:hypothetical protein
VSTYDEKLDDAPDPLIEDDPAHFDPAAIALEAVKADLDPAIFDKVDDRDLPRAKNFLDFVNGKAFLNISTMFPKQVEVGANLLGQFCPRCSNPKYILNLPDRKYLQFPVDLPLFEIYLNMIMLNFGVCFECGVGCNELIK